MAQRVCGREHRGLTDDSFLDGLDPYDLLDAEAARIDAYFGTLDADAARSPSRCSGWTERDVVAHLAAVEEYFHAGLDGRIADLFQRGAEAGYTSLDDWNQAGVRERTGRDLADVLREWREANARTRAEMRSRDGGEMGTSVGDYPVRWQAFHLASELATHADDAHVPVAADEEPGRTRWRAAVSRFALAEAKPEAEVEVVDGRTRVRVGELNVEVYDADLVEAVASRLPADHPLGADVIEALGITP